MQKNVLIGFYDDVGEKTNQPVPNIATVDELNKAQQVFEKLKTHSNVNADGEETYPYIITNGYRGFSTCRVCYCANGSAEYIIEMNEQLVLRIPYGYQHYVMDHKVKPDPLFLAIFD